MIPFAYILAGAASLIVVGLYIRLFISVSELGDRFDEVLTELADHRKVRVALYEKLADPEQIERDFERGAQAADMRRANRTTLPREGAGPPAKVYRPKLRGQKPGGWRPNRVN